MAKPTAPKIGTRVKVSILPSSDAKESVELDYRLLMPGNYSHSEPGAGGPLKERRIRKISKKGDFETVLKDINPKLKIRVANKLSDDPTSEMEVDLDFKSMKDFHPDHIITRIDPLANLLEAREKLKQLKLQVLKDVKLRKALESVLKEGGGSVDALMSKLASADAADKDKDKDKKK